MATLNALEQTTGSVVSGMAKVGESIPEPVAAIGGALAVAAVGAQVYPTASAFLGSMPTEQAVTVFAVLGGASGVASQFLAARNFEQMGRKVNVVELLPALVLLVGSAALFSHTLTTPEFLGGMRQFISGVQEAAPV